MLHPHDRLLIRSPLTLLLGLIAALSLLAACGSDIGEGSQLAGQRCFSDASCASGLVCYQRQCVPPAPIGAATDAGPTDDTGPEADVGPTIDIGVDTGDISLPPDGGACEPGARRCVDPGAFAMCVQDQEGTTRFTRFACDDGFVCVDGDCQRPMGCVDPDGDGYGDNCDLGPDCDQRRVDVHPGAQERCGTGQDENCNGQVDEGCDETTCCAGGCGAGQFCNTSCACEDYVPTVCQSQNQPCSVEGPSGDYYCRALGDDDIMRCYGLCDRVSPDRDATCPEADSFCTGIDQGDSNICLSTCDPALGCGTDTLGCRPTDIGERGGICTPWNPDARIGEVCDQGDFSCGSDAACVLLAGGDQPRCVETCRAFTAPPGATDCSQGYCLPVGLGAALCLPDNGSTGNQQCSPEHFSTCGEDRVGCVLRPNGQARCTELCRLSEGDADCSGQWECIDIGNTGPGLGACQPPAP